MVVYENTIKASVEGLAGAVDKLRAASFKDAFKWQGEMSCQTQIHLRVQGGVRPVYSNAALRMSGRGLWDKSL